MKHKRAFAPVQEYVEKRIEWTGAGGDHFLAVVVDRKDEVVAEFWGTKEALVNWRETHWPQLPAKYVPMAYGPDRRRPKSGAPPALRSNKRRDGPRAEPRSLP